MATLTTSSSSSSSPPPSLSHMPPISTSSSSAAFDDCSDDACSICLEPFTTHDPATITSCKHEYHLHCIIEWSQRSKECPICWQLLSLKDPISQELLTAVEAEKRLRSRNVYSSAFTNSQSITNSHSSLERRNDVHDDSCSDDSDFDEQLMQHLVAAASRARYVHRRERQRYSGAGPSEAFVFNPSMPASGMQPTLTTSLSGGSSPTSGVPSSDIQPPRSAFSPVDSVARNTVSESDDAPFKPSRPPLESARRLNTAEMFSFPESIKSKISAASARYKESISKSTRGLKEKLIARNASVKELSKGVQREMNAGIAGVARIIERLDLTSKRSTTSGIPVKGKSAQENNGIGQSPSDDSAVLVCHVSSDSPALVSNVVAGEVGIPPPSSVQNGHDAVKT